MTRYGPEDDHEHGRRNHRPQHHQQGSGAQYFLHKRLADFDQLEWLCLGSIEQDEEWRERVVGREEEIEAQKEGNDRLRECEVSSCVR